MHEVYDFRSNLENSSPKDDYKSKYVKIEHRQFNKLIKY